MSTTEDAGHVNPDCRGGKHTSCAGDGWDDETDRRVECSCECHGPIGEVPPAVLAYETRLDVTRAEVVRLTGERDAARARTEDVEASARAVMRGADARIHRLTARLRAVEALMERSKIHGVYPAASIAWADLRAALSSDTAPQTDEWCREESCRWRNWRSGSMPTHKRGTDCPVADAAPQALMPPDGWDSGAWPVHVTDAWIAAVLRFMRDRGYTITAPGAAPQAAGVTRECPMCHVVGGHGGVPRPDDPARRVRCPNEAIEQGRFVRIPVADAPAAPEGER